MTGESRGDKPRLSTTIQLEFEDEKQIFQPRDGPLKVGA